MNVGHQLTSLRGSEVVHLSAEHALDHVDGCLDDDDITTTHVDVLDTMRLEPCNNRLDLFSRRCDQVENFLRSPPLAY